MVFYLGGAHGGIEGGEAVVEGAEDGDHAVRVGLALLQRLPQHPRPPRQRIHRLRHPHSTVLVTSAKLLMISRDRE